jgi:hypothetical protein
LLLIAIKIWVVLRARRSVIETKDGENSSMSSLTENDIMLREYYYAFCSKATSADTLLAMLKKVNVYNPKTRQPDEMDEWFRKATPLLMHNGNCLLYINNYGYLEDTFWKNVSELNLHPEQDKIFQQLLFSCHYVDIWGCWYNNFNNMLYHFGYNYNILPEIEDRINSDERLKFAKDVYYRAKEYAKKDRKK